MTPEETRELQRLDAAAREYLRANRVSILRTQEDEVAEAMVGFARDFSSGEILAARKHFEDAMRRHRKNVEAEVRWLRLLVERLREERLAWRDPAHVMAGQTKLIARLRADVDALLSAKRPREGWLRHLLRGKVGSE